MELWQLNTFVEVARTLHFSRAAENLNLTQPAVSHHIKALEAELGQPLFVRGKTGIQLTPVGTTVLNYAIQVFELFDEMKTKIDRRRHSKKNILKIAAVTNSLDGMFAPMFPALRSRFHNLSLVFINAPNAETIIEMIRNKEIDIGFVRDGVDSKELIQFPFASTEFIVLCGTDHRLARRESVKLKELEGQDWILFEKENGYRRVTDKLFERHNFKPIEISETNDGSFLLGMVKQGGKITLFPRTSVIKELRSRELVSVRVENFPSEVIVNAVFAIGERNEFFHDFLESLFEIGLPEFVRLYAKSSKRA